MCSACITISPAASNSAVEASRRSLMLAECAERISTAPISSQPARSAPATTCSSTGSIALRPDVDRAGVVDLAGPAGRDEQRRLGELDHRGPGERRARTWRAAVHPQLDPLTVER